MSSPTRTVLVIGAGPGVSGSLARRYAEAGYAVGLLGNDADVLAGLSERCSALGVEVCSEVADLTDQAGADGAVKDLCGPLGHIDVLHFNPSAYRARDPLQLTAAELAADVTLGVGALLTVVQAARPAMRSGSRITATGSAAADSPSAQAPSLGVQKAGLRNLLRSLDKHLAGEGIRAVSVTVDGLLAPKDPDSPFHPDQVAAALFAAAHQPEDSWRAELRHPAVG